MKNLKNFALAAASLVIFSTIAPAQTVRTDYTTISAKPLSVKYIGEEGGYLLFDVTLQSTIAAKALFTIYDEKEGELFSSSYKINLKGLTVKVEKREADQVLNFEMVLAGKTYVKSFAANSILAEKTTVADMSITRL